MQECLLSKTVVINLHLSFSVKTATEENEELERTNKQLRLEMEQLVNQQDDVGKNVRIFLLRLHDFLCVSVLSDSAPCICSRFRCTSWSGPAEP